MRTLCLALFAMLALSACATPPVKKADLRGIKDPADALKRYYAERLEPVSGGYSHAGTSYSPYQLPAYYDAQGATQSADWARSGVNFRQIGWWGGVLLFAAGSSISVMADSNSPQRSAWWLSLMPAGLFTWTFHWVGHGWFTQPSVALYNKQLAEQLGLGVVPERGY